MMAEGCPARRGAQAGPAAAPRAPAGGDALSHLAFLYRQTGEYLERVLAFIADGLACSEPVFVALPGHCASQVRAAAGAAGWRLAVADMNELGRNPARITLALGAFASQHAGQRIRIVTEPLWPGRTDAETAEVMKHEARYAERAGLPADRRADLVLAVSEIAANTLAHTAAGGTVHIWASGPELICQVHDSGWITDPMAGRRRPAPDSPGQGLWVVNHVCDLVETRSGLAGTTTRLRFRLPGG